MVPAFTLFEKLYNFFSVRRTVLFSVTVLIVVLSFLASSRLHIQEDIVAMLPDDSSSVAQDFRLLQLAPFTRKLVITLKGGNPNDSAALIVVTDRLAEGLRAAGIANVMTGPANISGGFFSWLGASLPNLTTEKDLERLAAGSSPDEVRSRLRNSYEQLLSPEGWALKGNVQTDPLSFSSLALEKMRFLNMVPNMRLVQNHFVAADGTSALLVVDSAVSMTDSGGSRDLLERISTAITASVPAGMTATVVSGHRYTLVNADTIKRDLYVVLTLSVVAVFAIYLVFLRSLSAVFVFLVPTSILVIATGVIALYDVNVFAVTLGFGGVLLGMVDEYAMLIYFSCRQGGKDPAVITAEVSRPVIFGAAATLISFGIMLLSSLPGQRQLAVYSMVGIVAALLISLIVLPHLIKPLPEVKLSLKGLGGAWRLPRRVVIGVWLAVLALCSWQSTNIRFNGELGAVSMVTPELRLAEEDLIKTWGNMRGKALLFAEGTDLESALALNDKLFALISGRIPAGDLVSLAPLMPSNALQHANRARWLSFWQNGRAAQLEKDLTKSGETYGFSTEAFAPFLATLTTSPPAATVESLREAGMGELVDSLIIRSPDMVRVLTMVPDTPQVVAALSDDLKSLPGVRLVSQSRFGDNVGRAIIHDFTRYLTLTSALVLALLIVVFRSPSRVMLALVPVVTGLLCMLGIMGLCGIEFNIFNIAATILIIGLCVDYGIFMVCRLTEGSDSTTNRAVLVSGLTTLAGLGALALARHPSMHSIGITVLLGIGTGIPAALLVIPALCGKDME
ncbi:MAG: MMPL family transporter [Desulfuromonadaceae bacterium]|nr:MMPL family transporter [Desulfuromonadaceae bacterium]